MNDALKQGLGRTDADSSGHRTRSILVVSEVALSLMLLIGAGLMIRSFQKLRAVNPGFDSGGVLTMTAMVSHAKFPAPAQQISFFERVLQRVRALPASNLRAWLTTSLSILEVRTSPLRLRAVPPCPCRSNRKLTFASSVRVT